MSEKERRALLRTAGRQVAEDDSQINFDDIPRVLEWLKSKGAGHLTRINDILMNVMEAERRSSTGR